MDKKKIVGYILAAITGAVGSVISIWMTNQEIEGKVQEATKQEADD